MNSRRRVPALLLAACAALLAFAGPASAETLVGESTTSFTGESIPTPEETLVKGTASYDTSGSAQFVVTTGAPPTLLVEEEVIVGEPPKLVNEIVPNRTNMVAALLQASPAECTGERLLFTLIVPEELLPHPLAWAASTFGTPASARGVLFTNSGQVPIEAAKAVSGSTTTYTLGSAQIANRGFTCAAILVSGKFGLSMMGIPVKATPSSPTTTPPPSSSAPPTSSPASTPSAASLSIAKGKPTELKVGKWKTVKVKVTNTGGSTLTQGSLSVKPTKGVLVKPESQKIPTLAPGDSFSLSVRVELTKKAKKKSTLALAASGAGATSGSGSLVLKSATGK